MTGEIRGSIHEASQAMERLILSFKKYIDGMEASGASVVELQHLTKGIHAIRDSSGIYMTWAKHFAKLVGEEGEGAEEDLNGFLDEGEGIPGSPLFGP